MAEGDAGHAFRQLEVGDVQRFAHVQVLDVYLDVLGQVFRQTGNFEFGQDVHDLAAALFHAHGSGFVQDVYRHLHGDQLVGLYALEVRVDQTRLGRMALQVLDDHAFFLAVDVEGQDGGEERFVLGGVHQLLVVEADGNRGFVTTVDDGGHGVFQATQAAARTFPCIGPE